MSDVRPRCIELDLTLCHCRQVTRLMRRLGRRRHEAVGLVCMLLALAAETGTDGRVRIAELSITEWPAGPEDLAQALLDVGLVDREDGGILRIRNWSGPAAGPTQTRGAQP